MRPPTPPRPQPTNASRNHARAYGRHEHPHTPMLQVMQMHIAVESPPLHTHAHQPLAAAWHRRHACCNRRRLRRE